MSESLEDAVREHGALPMPTGPKPLPFPPQPRNEEERLRMKVTQLQDLLAEAVKDATRARRERDLIRERVSEPYGCRHCGERKRSHGRQWMVTVGMHAWERPTDEQVKDRMLARRAARMPLDVEELRSRVAELEAERHTTNAALDDAVQALREKEKHEATEAPDFFQRGRTYLRFVGDRELYFRVTSISTDNPNQSDSLAGDGPVAYGWSRTERSTTAWGPTGQTSFVGWHDVTEDGAQ